MVSLTVSTICATDGSMASRIWSAPTSTLRGRPVSRSRPRSVTRWASQSPGIGGPDGDLDVLRRALAEEQVVLAPGERDDVLVHLVAADPDAPADDDAAEADDRHLRGPAADVDDQAAGRLADRQAGTDRGGHRLLDQARPACAGVHRGVADGALLHLGHAGRDAEQHPRPRDEPDPVMDPVHEVLDHLLGDVEVADDAVAQGPDGDDVGRRPADHPLGLRADGQDAPGLGVDRDDGRFAHHDPAVADVDQGVGGPEVDPDVAGEDPEEAVEHDAEWILRRVGVARRRPHEVVAGRVGMRAGKPREYTRSPVMGRPEPLTSHRLLPFGR